MQSHILGAPFRLLYVHLLTGRLFPALTHLAFFSALMVLKSNCSILQCFAFIVRLHVWPSICFSHVSQVHSLPTGAVANCQTDSENLQPCPESLSRGYKTHLAVLTNSVCRVEVVQTLGAHRLTVLLILGRKTPCNKGVGLWGQSCQGSTLNRWERWSCMDTAYWREQNSSIRTQHWPKRRFTWGITFTWLTPANVGLCPTKQNDTATKTHRLESEIQWARNSSILFARWAWWNHVTCVSISSQVPHEHAQNPCFTCKSVCWFKGLCYLLNKTFGSDFLSQETTMCMSTSEEKLLGKLVSRNRIKSLKDQVQQWEVLPPQLYDSCQCSGRLSLEADLQSVLGKNSHCTHWQHVSTVKTSRRLEKLAPSDT